MFVGAVIDRPPNPCNAMIGIFEENKYLSPCSDAVLLQNSAGD